MSMKKSFKTSGPDQTASNESFTPNAFGIAITRADLLKDIWPQSADMIIPNLPFNNIMPRPYHIPITIGI